MLGIRSGAQLRNDLITGCPGDARIVRVKIDKWNLVREQSAVMLNNAVDVCKVARVGLVNQIVAPDRRIGRKRSDGMIQRVERELLLIAACVVAVAAPPHGKRAG